MVREPDLDRRLALPEERPRSRRIRPPLRRHLSAVMVGWTVELPPPAEVAMPTFKERRRKLARPAKTGRTRSGDAEYERRRPLATSALSIPPSAAAVRTCSTEFSLAAGTSRKRGPLSRDREIHTRQSEGRQHVPHSVFLSGTRARSPAPAGRRRRRPPSWRVESRGTGTHPRAGASVDRHPGSVHGFERTSKPRKGTWRPGPPSITRANHPHEYAMSPIW